MTYARLSPNQCLPPHRITHEEKFEILSLEFLLNGWGNHHPALVGYQNGSKVQLLSGSHRWAAALRAGIDIPVVVFPRLEVEAAWGFLEKWEKLMEAGNEQREGPTDCLGVVS